MTTPNTSEAQRRINAAQDLYKAAQIVEIYVKDPELVGQLLKLAEEIANGE